MSKYLLGLGLLYLVNSQSTCEQYTWSSSDWPNSETQDFESLIDYTSQGTRKSNCYIDKSDISEGGEYAGLTWQEATYENVNANKCPDGIRPLGYKKAKLGYDNDPAICITAYGADNYAVDLMVLFVYIYICDILFVVEIYVCEYTGYIGNILYCVCILIYLLGVYVDS